MSNCEWIKTTEDCVTVLTEWNSSVKSWKRVSKFKYGKYTARTFTGDSVVNATVLSSDDDKYSFCDVDSDGRSYRIIGYHLDKPIEGKFYPQFDYGSTGRIFFDFNEFDPNATEVEFFCGPDSGGGHLNDTATQDDTLKYILRKNGYDPYGICACENGHYITVKNGQTATQAREEITKALIEAGAERF